MKLVSVNIPTAHFLTVTVVVITALIIVLVTLAGITSPSYIQFRSATFQGYVFGSQDKGINTDTSEATPNNEEISDNESKEPAEPDTLLSSHIEDEFSNEEMDTYKKVIKTNEFSNKEVDAYKKTKMEQQSFNKDVDPYKNVQRKDEFSNNEEDNEKSHREDEISDIEVDTVKSAITDAGSSSKSVDTYREANVEEQFSNKEVDTYTNDNRDDEFYIREVETSNKRAHREDEVWNKQADTYVKVKPKTQNVIREIKYSGNEPKSTAIQKDSNFSNKELKTSNKVKSKSEGDVREIIYPSKNEKCTKRLPQAIIVGIQKSGTTALLQFLSIHPQIAACLHPVETKYFSQYYHRPLSWYKNLMPCSYSNQITMEKSPPYFYRGFCAQRIRKMNPKTKIIIIVKDPIVRAQSMYAMYKEHSQVGHLSFANLVTTNRRVKTNSLFIDFSNYQKYARAWTNTFSAKQILVLDGQNFEIDPAQELRKVEHFLQIGSYFTPEKFVFNSTKGKYCLATGTKTYECLGENKGRAHPEMSKDVRTLLQDYFRPLNKQFFKMVHREFDWGY